MGELIEINDNFTRRKWIERFHKEYARRGKRLNSLKEIGIEREKKFFTMTISDTGETIDFVMVRKLMVWKEDGREKGFVYAMDARYQFAKSFQNNRYLAAEPEMAWFIMDIYVKPAYRNNGVAKRMLKAFIDTHIVVGISMERDVMSKNLGFYSELGFCQMTMPGRVEGETPLYMFDFFSLSTNGQTAANAALDEISSPFKQAAVIRTKDFIPGAQSAMPLTPFALKRAA